MAEYSTLRNEALNIYKDRNSCTVISLAVVTGLSFGPCQKEMLHQGRLPGTGARSSQYLAALWVLGFDHQDVTSQIHSKTARSLNAELAGRFPGQKFLVRVRGHLMGFDGHQLQDWASATMKRIVQVWRVVDARAVAAPVQAPVAAPKLVAAAPSTTLAALCLELGMDTTKARRILRKAGLNAPYTDLIACRFILTGK